MHRCIIGSVALFALSAAAGARAEAVASDDCPNGSAAVQLLAKVENTRDSGYDCLGVRVDKNANIVGVIFEKHESPGNGPGRSLPLAHVIREFTPAEIGAPSGVVLDGTPGHDAIRLRGSIPLGATAAPLAVTYLHNGIAGDYRDCGAVLERSEVGRWRLVNSAHRPVSRILVQTWGLPILGTVGIETLQGLCAPLPAASQL